MDINELKERVLNNEKINKKEALSLSSVDVLSLAKAADEIRSAFCGNAFDLCAITNGKSGRCPENCKFCAQSAHYAVEVETFPLLKPSAIGKEVDAHGDKGVLRFSVVTSGRALVDEEIEAICQGFAMRKNKEIALCASLGFLKPHQFAMLKEAGVTRYHNNLETSRRFFPEICSTHTYDEKVDTIKMAQAAGLTVCSGGIMGLGETMEDRIDLALLLRELGISSVPINILNPIPGTPLEHQPILSEEELQRIVGIYRFLLPHAVLRLAGGRGLFADKGESLFLGGANGAITGDMLTTAGISVAQDLAMVKDLGYEVKL